MKLNQLKIGSFALASAIFIASCGGGGQEKSENASSEFDSAKEQIASDVEKVLMDLPPPSEVPYLLMAAGADFDESLVNSMGKIDNYATDASKAALNLGVYATDIGYLSSYEKSETALDYMGESQKLAGPVGVADAIDYGMVARFEKNMENRDSLTAVINDVMQKASQRLSELDQLNNGALLLAGSWIEGIYISTTIVNNYPDDLPEESRTLILEPLVKIVIDQKKSLDDLMKVMSDVPGNASVTSMKSELDKVNTIYNGELAEVSSQISNNTGSFVLKPSTLNNLRAEVTRIRASIVE